MYRFEKENVTKDFYIPSSNICSIYEFDENFEKNLCFGIGTIKTFIWRTRLYDE